MAQTTLRDYLQNTEDAISTGRIDDAMQKCQHILTYFPDSLEAQRLLGEVYLAQGLLEEAQQTFDWILANDPENVIVYCDRALISERMSDIDTALDCYQQAYELSRGNSQIRQEFNALSAKVGQQDFMFSRAGLARLYMRGDLLPQAIQEWEAVLSTSPDRLDARMGLLETYWREGLYDQVEQLATQILEDIPGCLKALLLLAHVTSAYNPEQARALIQRAETLDPEMVMAHDIFNDLLASQPNNPFLALIKIGPPILPEVLGGEPTFSSISEEEIASVANNILSPALASEPSDAQFGWSNLESWSELDTMSVPQQHAQPVPESSVHATWSSNSMQNLDTWTAFSQQAQSEPELEAWQEPQEVEKDLEPATAEEETIFAEQPWNQLESFAEQGEHFAEHADGSASVWDNLSSLPPLPSIDIRETESKEADLPSPPAWLDMLTRGDGFIAARQTPSQIEQASPVPGQLTVRPTYDAQTPSESEEELPVVPEQEEEPTFFFASDEKDVDMGWPEWLKSLGAETMEPEPPEEDEFFEALTAVPESQPQAPVRLWADQADWAAPVPPENEQKLVTSLEDLEYNLHAQGFVPLEPGSLSTIAQEQREQEPTLSSALAQLSNPVLPEPVSVSSSPEETPVSPLSEPISVSSATGASESALVTAYHNDALLEMELETTMRRPVIRVQAMHQRSAAQQEQFLPDRGRSGPRAGASKTSNDNMSYKERLLKGYHSQLDGAYDDAMQEYRIIIRNAPELLGEVISNLRALLKLVPRYALGYRVLGDAYMRQGEYLQAMEAYNKALNMAKKAKSQIGGS